MPRGLLQKATDSVIEANFELAVICGEEAEGWHTADFEVVAAGLQNVEILIGELEVELGRVDRLASEGKLETQAVAQSENCWNGRPESLIANNTMAQSESIERVSIGILLEETMPKFAWEAAEKIASRNTLIRPDLSGREE